MNEIKILGFVMCPNYQETLKRTWEVVFSGFEKTLFAWGSRSITTLQQHVSVLQKFALSKLWYVAQMLPLPNKVLNKIDSRMSRFIFQGRPERLELSEIENRPEAGGLGLTCLATKAESLLLRQSLRVLARPDETCSRHLGYWLGNFLEESFPHLALLGPSAPALYPQFPLKAAVLEVIEEGLMRGEFEPKKLKEATTKAIYKSRTKDVLLPPKIEEKYPLVDFKNVVYPRLVYRILEPESRDILFSIVHGLVHNKNRMFLQGRVQDPHCPLPECQNQVQDLEHLFCSCFLVVEAWGWILSRLKENLPATPGELVATYTNKEFLMLQFSADTMDTKECTCLLGNYWEISK